jgi:hypothetical protein
MVYYITLVYDKDSVEKISEHEYIAKERFRCHGCHSEALNPFHIKLEPWVEFPMMELFCKKCGFSQMYRIANPFYIEDYIDLQVCDSISRFLKVI